MLALAAALSDPALVDGSLAARVAGLDPSAAPRASTPTPTPEPIPTQLGPVPPPEGRRAADGRILEWDSHGYGCAVCIDVARDSMQMYNSGASVSSIRGAIDAKYGSRFPQTMKTPKPPAKK